MNVEHEAVPFALNCHRVFCRSWTTFMSLSPSAGVGHEGAGHLLILVVLDQLVVSRAGDFLSNIFREFYGRRAYRQVVLSTVEG